MKKTLFLSLTFLLISTLSVQLKAQEEGLGKNQKIGRQNPFKSGYIKYKLTGSTEGIKEVWWDNYGEQRKEIEKSKSSIVIFGMKNEEERHILTICDKDVCYMVDYVKDIAEKRKEIYQNEIADQKSAKEREKLGEEMFKSMGGKKEGTEKVLGYPCDVYSLLGSKIWSYKGVPLKTEANLLGMKANIVAVTFKRNISIPKNTFTPPKDVTFTVIDNEDEEYSNKIMENTHSAQNEEEVEKEKKEKVEEGYKKYSYKQFKKDMKTFKYGSYHKITSVNVKGTYTATFIKGFSRKTLTVIASSRKNPEYEKLKKVAKEFDYKGKKTFYTKTSNSSSIIIDIDKYDTYIILRTNPIQSKKEMLKIRNKFVF